AYYRTEHGLHNELKVPRPQRRAGQSETPAAIRIAPRIVTDCDVVVVGSGATGGWAAKELTEAGFSVLVLESGASLAPDEHSRDKRLPYQLPLRNMLDADWQFKERQPVQSKVWACDEYSQKFFVDDIDNPYETPDKKDFIWVQGSRVGGRMNVWGRQVYRYSDADFKAADLDGFGENWPISYSDLAPFYDEVEDFIGVSGSTEGLPQLPDGKFLPPMELTDGEKILKERVEARWNDRKVIIGRTATLTAPHRGRSACHYCGSCYRGCPTFSFFDSVSHTLSAAAQTGKLSLTSDALVTKVLVDQKTKLASGVEYVDKST
ncbi:MAG: GMC family oxidoreductase N-terminal domain-containing protein, partial [Gammaproteobacteria bacterium]